MRFLVLFLIVIVSACAEKSVYVAEPNVALDNAYRLDRLLQCRSIAESCGLYSESAYLMSTDLRLIPDPESGKREGAEVEIVTSEENTPDPELRYGGRSLISCQFQGERLTSVLKNGEVVPFKQCETFMVFFDWNKSDIRPEAFAVVESAAVRAKRSPYRNVVVIGHADRSGTGKYNFALSDRRAKAVKSVLVRLGIPANKIVTKPKGETDLLVPTEDGVREPQNRRAEIKIGR